MPAPTTAPNGAQLEQAQGRTTIFVPFAGGVPAVVGARRTIGPTGAAVPTIRLGVRQWLHIIGFGFTILTDITDASGGLALNGTFINASTGLNLLGNLKSILLPDPGTHTPSAALGFISLADWTDSWFRSDDFNLAQSPPPTNPWTALQFPVMVTNLDGALHPFAATWQFVYEIFNEVSNSPV